MKLINHSLSKAEIKELKKEFRDYLKLTVDLQKKCLVAGGELHADGESLLLKSGSQQDDIWGGGIDLVRGQIDASAVLNLRPNLDNDSLEILDPRRRGKFVKIVKEIFKQLWL